PARAIEVALPDVRRRAGHVIENVRDATVKEGGGSVGDGDVEGPVGPHAVRRIAPALVHQVVAAVVVVDANLAIGVLDRRDGANGPTAAARRVILPALAGIEIGHVQRAVSIVGRIEDVDLTGLRNLARQLERARRLATATALRDLQRLAGAIKLVVGG